MRPEFLKKQPQSGTKWVFYPCTRMKVKDILVTMTAVDPDAPAVRRQLECILPQCRFRAQRADIQHLAVSPAGAAEEQRRTQTGQKLYAASLMCAETFSFLRTPAQ
jgi:hypothetical protein